MSHGDLIAPPRYVPQILIGPPEERDGRDHINLLFSLACLHTRRFESSVSLIRHCEPMVGPDLGAGPVEWIGIAARDAALSIYHFRSSVEAIGAAMKDCPTLRSQVDAAILREAKAEFSRAFPDAKYLRHAVSHLADQLSTRERVNELRRPGEFLAWETQIGPHLTMASKTGRQVRLTVDEHSLSQLRGVLAAVCDAFAGASPEWENAFG